MVLTRGKINMITPCPSTSYQNEPQPVVKQT
jgi:hypothetical protein